MMYSPFLTGPNRQDLVKPMDHVLVLRPDQVPKDRFGFNELAYKESWRAKDSDLLYSASNWLGYMAHLSERTGTSGDADYLSHCLDEEGRLHPIYTHDALIRNIDIRAIG